MGAMLTLRQIRSVVAVYEEGSFTAAAVRENATQSGISQHVAAVEAELGLRLFERGPEGVTPTPAGERYYARAVEALRALAAAEAAARDAETLSGTVTAGLMPTFTRAVLAPALARLAAAHPAVTVRVREGYSGTLTDMVRAGELDFALVPAFAPGPALVATPLGRDREMLVARVGAFAPNVPIAAAALGPLKLVLPGPANTRRARLDAYFAANGIPVAAVLEMDTMMGTLDLVARSDYMTVLPAILLGPDRDGSVRAVAPLDAPPLYADFIAIEPARNPLSPQARALLDVLREEVAAQASD